MKKSIKQTNLRKKDPRKTDARSIALDLERDGYAVIAGAIAPDDAKAFRELLYGKLAHYRATLLARLNLDIDDAEAVARYVASLTNTQGGYQGLDKELQHLLRGEFPLDVRLDPALRAIAHQGTLMEVLGLALGSDALRMHYPPMARFKGPKLEQTNVPLHQDWSYNSHLQNFTTVWVPLCPITEACGGVDVLVGSHKLGRLDHQKQVIWGNYVEPESLGRAFETRHVTMGVGDVLLFGPYTLHRSHPNTSRSIRCSIDYRFFPRTLATPKHYYDPSSRQVVAPAEAA